MEDSLEYFMRKSRSIWALAISLVVGCAASSLCYGDDDRMTIAVLGYSADRDHAFFAPAVVNMAEAEIQKTGRFTLVERRRLERIIKEQRTDFHSDPKTAIEIGNLAGAQCVVYGDIESIICNVQPHESNGRISYSTQVEVTIHSTATMVETGKIWLSPRFTGKDSSGLFYSSTPPSYADKLKWVRSAAQKSVAEFVKRLVPPIHGTVIGTPEGYVMIDRGNSKGLTGDMDLWFYRYTAMTNADGSPVVDPRTRKQIHMRLPVQGARDPRKPGEKMVCVGHAYQIDENTALVQIGFNSTGGIPLLGGRKTKFKTDKNLLKAIQKGDGFEAVPRGAD